MERLFGTDGIRGIAGEFPLDPHTIEWVGRSLVRNLAHELGRTPSLVIGRDTRESGPMIETALAAGARAEGAGVESGGVITTPGVAFLARTVPFDAGVVNSASHNPYRDNGIKVFSTSGKKLADEVERHIENDISRWTRESRSGDRIYRETATLETNDVYDRMYQDYLAAEIGEG